MKPFVYLFLISMLGVALAACGEEDEGPSCFTCLYEKRSSGCGSSGFGPWEEGSSTIDFELRDGLTPEGFCREAFPASDLECAGGCCVSFQFRNVRVGPC